MPLTLYFLEASPPARSVNMVIHALGLSAEHKTVNLMKQEQNKPEYLKMNPLHTVPMIDDDGFILWESRAIMTYLVSKYGKDDSLYPKDLKKRAVVDQRLHFSNDVFFILRMCVKPILFLGQKLTEDHLARVRQVQEDVEKLLEGHKFMAGDQLTVADYSYVTIVDVLEVIVPTEGKHPLTKAWFQRCKSTMKDFDKVFTKGAEDLREMIKNKI